jgi:ribosome-binding protein aMBF1 (putative translation factor)
MKKKNIGSSFDSWLREKGIYEEVGGRAIKRVLARQVEGAIMRKIAMSKVKDLHKKWMKSREYRKAYDELAPEFALARAVIEARVTAGLTQEQLAKRMATTQSVVARLESGRTRPSTQTLERLVAAMGTRLRISFEPAGRRRTAA